MRLLDVAQELLGELCGRWAVGGGGSERAGWTSPTSSSRSSSAAVAIAATFERVLPLKIGK